MLNDSMNRIMSSAERKEIERFIEVNYIALRKRRVEALQNLETIEELIQNIERLKKTVGRIVEEHPDGYQVYGDILTTTFIGMFSLHECMQILGSVWVLCLILKMTGIGKLFKKIIGYFAAAALITVFSPMVELAITENSFGANAMEIKEPALFDGAIIGLVRLYNECLEENRNLSKPNYTAFPVISVEIGKIKDKDKFKTAELLYKLYYLCLQENRKLLGNQGI